MPGTRRVLPMLSCQDLDRSRAFYRDLLGGEEAFRFPAEGDPEFITVRLGESELGLGKVAQQPLHGQPQRPAQGHRVELCVYVDDVDEMVLRLREHGAPVLLEPVNQPWGERTAFIGDPDGNLLMLTC